jgi:fluoroacetyl-CoA thioesterase
MPISRLTPGLCHHATYAVTREMSPPHIDGILATSRMIGLIEDTCLTAVRPYLDDGQTSVGTRVNVTHVGIATAGEEVTITVRLVKVTRHRLLSFEVEVESRTGVIGAGTHQRLVVERATFPDPRPTPGDPTA